LVHAFVSSRVDRCNTMLAESSKATTDRLQCVLYAAARAVSRTHNFHRGLTYLLHSDLHWLDVPHSIQFPLEVTVRRCLQGNAPQYLVDCCKSTTNVVSCPRLHSASHSTTPSHQVWSSGTFCCRPDSLELVPDYLRDPLLSEDTFRRSLKTYLFALY